MPRIEPRIYKLGEKGSGIRLQGAVQDYDQLTKQVKEQLKNDPEKLFVDTEFPAEDSSLFASDRPDNFKSTNIEWKRPKDIVWPLKPKLFVDGASRFDVKQGQLGNCWVLAGVASLAMRPELLHDVVPPNQSFEEEYTGIFRFRFWQFGKWIEVVIDDLLPTCNGSLLFTHSEEKTEFWPALLEKAYAKLHGYWYALTGGFSSDIFEDLTGGLCLIFSTSEAHSHLFDILLEAQEKKSLLSCSTPQPEKGSAKAEEFINQQVVGGHAYGITKVWRAEKSTKNQREKIFLLRVRNPWGFHEWKGAWSDFSDEWESISEAEKNEMEYEPYTRNGEFWISFEDFKNCFSQIHICYLNPSFLIPKSIAIARKHWEEKSFEGEWVRGVSAGGCGNVREPYQHNPQYRITLKEKSIVIVALMQKNRRIQRSKGPDVSDICVRLSKFPEAAENDLPKPLNGTIMRKNPELKVDHTLHSLCGNTMSYVAYREVGCRITLQPGAYCMIPSSFNLGTEGEFLLRVFSEKPINMEEYDVEVARCKVADTIIEKSDLDKRAEEITRIMKERKYFREAAHQDWELDWNECKLLVQRLLQKELSKESFGEDIYRSIVALLDADYSGKLGFHEFRTFWKKCKIWTVAFDIHAKDGSKELEEFQLRQVFKTAGYDLNGRILSLLIRRYGEENGHVKFENYFVCAARLDKIIANYEELVAAKKINASSLTLEEWIKIHVNSS